MEHGLNEVQSKALGVHQNKAYAMYDDSHAGPEIPNAMGYAQKFDVTPYKNENYTGRLLSGRCRLADLWPEMPIIQTLYGCLRWPL